MKELASGIRTKEQARQLAEYNERVAEGYDTRYPTAAEQKEKILQSVANLKEEWNIE